MTASSERLQLAAQRAIAALNDHDLARELRTLADRPRDFPTAERKALLAIAAGRIQNRTRRYDHRRDLKITADVTDGLGGINLLQEWMDGDLPDDAGTWSLLCGAGVGNGLLRLEIRGDHGRVVRTEQVDMRDVARTWLSAALAELDALNDPTS